LCLSFGKSNGTKLPSGRNPPSVTDRCKRLAAAYAEHDRAIERHEEAAALLAETTSVGWLVRRWRRLPSPDEQHQVVENARLAVESCQTELEREKQSLQGR